MASRYLIDKTLFRLRRYAQSIKYRSQIDRKTKVCFQSSHVCRDMMDCQQQDIQQTEHSKFRGITNPPPSTNSYPAANLSPPPHSLPSIPSPSRVGKHKRPQSNKITLTVKGPQNFTSNKEASTQSSQKEQRPVARIYPPPPPHCTHSLRDEKEFSIRVA